MTTKFKIDFNKEYITENIVLKEEKLKGEIKIKPVPPSRASDILVGYSDLRYLKVFSGAGLIYIYKKESGYYKNIDLYILKTYVARIFKQTGFHCVRDHRYIKSVVDNLLLEDQVVVEGKAIFDQGYIALENGILNLDTKVLQPWTPNIFLSSALPFSYDPKSECNSFKEYLNSFCMGYQDRVEFIRSFFYAVLHQDTSLQVFLYLYGPGGSGKSTIANILAALVGYDGVISTTLKALNTDQFEVLNLVGKKLVLISDSEKYSSDLAILKAYTGGDSLRGRKMYTQGNINVNAEGLIVIVANNPFQTRDNSNAIKRRIRAFQTQTSYNNREPLFSNINGVWKGSLLPDLPGILNWILSLPKGSTEKYIVNYAKNVPSLESTIQETASLISPLDNWLSQEVNYITDKGEAFGSYLGYSVQTPKGEREMKERKALYPAFVSWCKREGYTPYKSHTFTLEIMNVCKNKGYRCEKVRRKEGMFITLLSLKDFVFDRDYLYGAPLQIISPEEISFPSKENYTMDLSSKRKENGSDTSSKILIENKEIISIKENSFKENNIKGEKSIHHSLSKDLYKKYIGYLVEKNPLKDRMNRFSKEIMRIHPDINKRILDNYTKDMKISSLDFQESAKRVIDKGLNKVQSFGGIPFSYKQMGASPRILPVSYGNSINNTKRVVRDCTYSLMAKEAIKEGFVIIDLDLKSCYTSILLGLYPKELELLQRAVSGPGLWNFIKEEFNKNNKTFHKEAVKICVYSSFFLGGNKAMMDGILESYRKDLGLTGVEFRKSSFYEEAYTIAQDVTEQMQNSSIIDDFRDISQYIKTSYMDDYLTGPTGHSYKVSEHTFRTAYPNYLQSYEFALLSEGFLRLKQEFPECFIIGHYHDGNVLVVPEDKKDQVLEFYGKTIKQIGTELSLQYPQTLEIKKTFSFL